MLFVFSSTVSVLKCWAVSPLPYFLVKEDCSFHFIKHFFTPSNSLSTASVLEFCIETVQELISETKCVQIL